MMEITENSNFRIKALVILLISILFITIGTVCFAVNNNEPGLNRKVYFTGNTYKYPNQDRVRKEYKDGELGCGIITIVSKKAKHPYYVTGEGWIDKVETAEKFIRLKFDKIENGINSSLKVNGEYVQVDSNNNAVVKYEDGKLIAGIDGETTVNFITKEGKEIEILAAVVDGEMELNIPEKTVTANLNELDVAIADKKVEVVASGEAGAALVIEDGVIGLGAEGNGTAELKVKGETVATIDADGTATVVGTSEGIQAEVSSNQTLTILDKLNAKLHERATATIGKESAEATFEGSAEVNDNEIASGEAGLSYTYGEEDPKGMVNGQILGQQIGTGEYKTLPIFSTLKSLISKIIGKDLPVKSETEPVEQNEEPAETQEVEQGETLMGDVNNDDVIDKLDADLIQEFSTGSLPEDATFIEERADLNNDNKIDCVDALCVLQLI